VYKRYILSVFSLSVSLILAACGEEKPVPAKPQTQQKPSAQKINQLPDLESFDSVITRDLFTLSARHPERIDAFLIDAEQADGSRCYYASSYVSGNQLAGICVAATGTFHDGTMPPGGSITPALSPYKARWSKVPGSLAADEQAQVIVAQLPASHLDMQISLTSKKTAAKGADFDILHLAKVALPAVNAPIYNR
jgi:hypothetical protein